MSPPLRSRIRGSIRCALASRQLIARGANVSYSPRTCRDIVIEDLDAAAFAVWVILQDWEIRIRFARLSREGSKDQPRPSLALHGGRKGRKRCWLAHGAQGETALAAEQVPHFPRPDVARLFPLHVPRPAKSGLVPEVHLNIGIEQASQAVLRIRFRVRQRRRRDSRGT